jgi:hypothetical protein
MIKAAAALALTLATVLPAAGDGFIAPRPRYHSYFYLPPERHVIEVVQPPYSGNFIINGTRFTAKSPACLRWAAGERIRLLAGDWHGHCIEAVFYNVTLRSTCEMWCR